MSKKTFFNGKIISILLSVIGLFSVFVSGIFSSNTYLEKVASYASNIAASVNTDNKLFSINVGKTNESGDVLDPYNEFHRLYGLFKQTKITFGSAYNANKERQIYLPNAISDNISIFYLGPSGTMPYNKDDPSDKRIRHYIYPIQLMYDKEYLRGGNYTAYISLNHANKMLENRGIEKKPSGEYDPEDYETIMGEEILISIDGVNYKYVISNIYFPYDYYCNGLTAVLGDFILTTYNKGAPDILEKKNWNMYFMSEYSYQNKYFMSYINGAYSSKKFDVRINHHNLSDEVDDDYLLSFYYDTDYAKFDALYYILSVSSIAALFAAMYFAFSTRLRHKFKRFNWVNVIPLFIPYIVMNIIYLITGNVSFFSEASCKFNALLIIAYIIVGIILEWRARKKEKMFSKDNFHEANI